MKLLIILALSVLGLVKASDVIELKDSDFEEKAKEHDILLAEFYAPWCGHCKRLAPEYEKAATKLKKNDPPIALVKVDCTSEKATCDKHGVSGFPTLKIFRHGELSADYDGPREADGIVKYMRGQAGASSKELNALTDLKKFLDDEEFSVVGFFEKEDGKLMDSYRKVADTERDRFRFAHTTAKVILDKYGYTDDIVIFAPKRLHNKFEESHTKYDGNYDTDKIKKFITNQMHGLCGHRTQESIWQFTERPIVVVYYNVDYVKDPKGTNYWRNRILKVAQDYKRKVHFAFSNREDMSHEVTECGLEGDASKPVVCGFGPSGEKYPMKEAFSVDALKEFADDIQAGNIEQFMKSEDVPEPNDGPVKVLVAKNFKEIIDSEKDALIEFYAPWCGHCKKLAPIYDELGEKLKEEDVVIAKMDATANDVPSQYNVQGFPTIFWVPKGQAPQPYQGGRELDDFIKYIAKESSTELKGWNRDGKMRKVKKEL
jgi:protein disulfide isomerase family A protein 3